LFERAIVSGNDVVARGLVHRDPLVQDLLHLVHIAFLLGQRRTVLAVLDPLHDGGHFGGQPEHASPLSQRGDVLLPEHHAAAGIDDGPVLFPQPLADLGLHVPEIVPAPLDAFGKRVSRELYAMSMTVRRGVSSESGTQVSPAFGLMPTGVQWIKTCALGMVRPSVCGVSWSPVTAMPVLSRRSRIRASRSG